MHNDLNAPIQLANIVKHPCSTLSPPLTITKCSVGAHQEGLLTDNGGTIISVDDLFSYNVLYDEHGLRTMGPFSTSRAKRWSDYSSDEDDVVLADVSSQIHDVEHRLLMIMEGATKEGESTNVSDMECSLIEPLNEHPLDPKINSNPTQAESLLVELAHVLGVSMLGREDEVHQFGRELLAMEVNNNKQIRTKPKSKNSN